MIDYTDMTITLGTNRGKIARFEVWFITPYGMFPNVEEAKTKMAINDLPLDLLRPISVAICDNGLFEPLGG